MTFFEHAFAAIPQAATSPLALAAYVATIVGWVVLSIRVARNRNLLQRIEKLPERDRLPALVAEMGSVPMKGFTPADWLRARITRYYFVGYMSTMLTVAVVVVIAIFGRGRPDVPPVKPADVAHASEFLELLYAGKLDQAYGSLSESLRGPVTVSIFTSQVKTMLYQYQGAPLKRQHVSTRTMSDFADVTFEAEWDAQSTLREVVTLKREHDAWILWRFSIGPKEWPELTTPSTLTAQSLEQLLGEHDSPSATGASAPSSLGLYIPQPGWIARLGAVEEYRADRTCDRAAFDAASRHRIVLKSVAGGCTLDEGKRVVVFGKVESLKGDLVSLDAVRLFPANP